jgi:arylsulfatase
LEYRYDPPFKFAGKIDKLTFQLKPFPPEQSAEAGSADRPGPGAAHRQ